MDYSNEVQTKLARARALMAEHGLSALWLRTVNSVAWITGGVDVAVNHADTIGVASVVITPDSATVYTNAIEGPRLRGEDGVEARGFALKASPWEGEQPPELGSAPGVDGLRDPCAPVMPRLRPGDPLEVGLQPLRDPPGRHG